MRSSTATSALALSVGAIIAVAMIAPAQAASPNTGLWGGGGSLSSLTLRQVFDCYTGSTVTGDGYAASGSFNSATPTPALLPTACGAAVTDSVEGLYAAVGSGRGQQAFIANDPLQLVNGGPNANSNGIFTVSTPATKPPFINTGDSSTNFNTYPYPALTFAAGDNPLPSAGASSLTTAAYYFSTTTGWASSDVVTSIALASGTTSHAVSYPVTTVGQPVQFPLFEVPVAIAVNTSNLTGLKSAGATASAAGAAIQLSTAQVCAIFAGVVTDWSSQAPIATLNNSGTVGYQLFSDDNLSVTSSSDTSSAAYASSSTPILVTYRGDGSGTSYIFTNYLKSNCQALDNGSGTTVTIGSTSYTVAANHYAAIFGSSSLPSTSFSTLKNLVSASNGSTVTTYWQSATGSGGVAAAIGTGSTSPATPGAIGYLSADFTTPYANTDVISGAPHSASVQNENQRLAGVYHPSAANKFVPPTPANADNAYASLETFATVSGSGTYTSWDLYQYSYPSSVKVTIPSGTGTTVTTIASLSGKSILGIPVAQNAYPVVGTTYLYAYSCYANVNADSGNPPVVDLLNWFYNYGNDSADPSVAAVLQNNGFHELNVTASATRKNLAATIYSQYLTQDPTWGISQAGAAGTACASVSGGA